MKFHFRILIGSLSLCPDTEVDGSFLVPVQSEPRDRSHFDAGVPILLAAVLHGGRKSSGRAVLLVAPLRLRADSTSEEHHEASDGIQRHAGHCCAKQRRIVQGKLRELCQNFYVKRIFLSSIRCYIYLLA